MRNIKYIIFTLLLLAISCRVSATSITSAEFKDGKFSVSGEGTKSVQIVVFNANKEPVYMGTSVVEDGKYSLEIPKIVGMSAGDYTIKTADYNGENSITKEVNVTEAELTTNNPATSDNIIIYVVLIIVSAFGIGLLYKYIKKNHLFN